MKWRRQKAVERAVADAAARERVEESRRQYAQAKAMGRKAVEVDQKFKAEIQRNQWTDTLFGVIQTGRQ